MLFFKPVKLLKEFLRANNFSFFSINYFRKKNSTEVKVPTFPSEEHKSHPISPWKMR